MKIMKQNNYAILYPIGMVCFCLLLVKGLTDGFNLYSSFVTAIFFIATAIGAINLNRK